MTTHTKIYWIEKILRKMYGKKLRWNSFHKEKEQTSDGFIGKFYQHVSKK